MTDNVFAAVLGSKHVKWDAFWHFMEWLLDPDEGHRLGDSVQTRIVAFAFGNSELACKVKREYPVSGQSDGKGKWADLAVGLPDLNEPKLLIVMDDIGHRVSGGRRKLDNLASYLNESAERYPSALIRAVAITDAPLGKKLANIVGEVLGTESQDHASRVGWNLLPLHRLGSWVREALDERAFDIPEKMRLFLDDFAKWCDPQNLEPLSSSPGVPS